MPPFDLVEAESELVAGYMVEYGSTPYMMLMLSEYVAICTMCAMSTILFLGGWLPPFPVVPFTWVPGVIWFVLKAGFVFFMFAMVKAFVDGDTKLPKSILRLRMYPEKGVFRSASPSVNWD